VADPNARERGPGGPRLVAYTSAEGHYSLQKNAGLAGLGRRSVRAIQVDERGRMSVPALLEAIEADRRARHRPFLVNATAGTTVRGAFDPIARIAAVSRGEGLWLHVDGAFGGTLLLSPEHRHRLAGCERADSFAWDPHKMMGIPLQSSVLLVSRPGLLSACLDENAEYLFQSDPDELNPGRRSLQCGRPNDALKLWAAWQRLGDRGWAERVGRQVALARRAARLVDADPELLLVEEPASVNVCFEVPGARQRRRLREAGSGWAPEDRLRNSRRATGDPPRLREPGPRRGTFPRARTASTRVVLLTSGPRAPWAAPRQTPVRDLGGCRVGPRNQLLAPPGP